MPRGFRYTLCIAVICIAIGKSVAQDNSNSTAGSAKGSVAASNIVSGSQSTNVPAGSNATFSVVTTGGPTLSYQWSIAGSNVVGGQTNRSLALISVERTNAEQFQVAVTNGSTASSNVTQASDGVEQGRGLFTKHCAICHGPNGEGGRGPTLAQTALPRASDEASLLQIISEGIKGTQMPAAHLERDDIGHVATFVRFLGTQPHQAAFGDPVRGARIYANKGGCVQCHTIHGKGGGFGPDLSDVGLRRSPEYLRRSLVDPNADVPESYSPWRHDVSLPENFLYVRLVTKDGQDLSGVRVNEDTFSIQIRDATGTIHSFYKSELTELHKDFGKSPMPSYGEALSYDELNDLVAYLASLQNKK